MLFSNFKLGSTELTNRIAMAPMTRSRASIDGLLNDDIVRYYQQRATAGLIITESAPVSPVARGYAFTPGIYNQQQIDGWKKVTDAVHAEGGKIFIQLWHVGRVSHTSITGGEQPLAPSAIKGLNKGYGPLDDGSYGFVDQEIPKAMSKEDIIRTQQEFVQAAKNAVEAGFDGVELHSANTYLFEQFMLQSANQRSDEYGGSQENRVRFLVETVTAVAEAIGVEKVGFRLSPYLVIDDPDVDPEMPSLALKAMEALNHLDLAYVHFSENVATWRPVPSSFRRQVREIWHHPVIVAGRHTKESAQDMLDTGYADLVAFGEYYISNPDLVYRFKQGVSLNGNDKSTYYGGGAKGLTDYPIADPAVKHLADA
ncbi:alkene reductase [Vibrio sp. SCSIO 43137]|uniref:alkene reductase n=1 Tax=Vibrio sp. SCSIO 43137 TaxID=3021011 RepID=UPI002307E0A2|nr:alkene reductase [Vibrio sp. SCSIO 43137]WCE31511.1 alkene reductase [Vibrio sp. SCSIO 43137]